MLIRFLFFKETLHNNNAFLQSQIQFNMRTFLNWEILKRIEQSPKEYIIQRNVDIMGAFLYGYERILLKLKNKEELERKYIQMPSIEDYALKKYNAHNIGTRNFTSIISFISEDELDFYNNYISFLKEYETKYPVEETICYILRSEVKSSENKRKQTSTEPIDHISLAEHSFLKEILPHMRKRFLMHFGKYSLASLRAFIDGYFLCKEDYKISLTSFEQKIKSFIESIICENLILENEFTTWDRKYRYNLDWNSWGYIDTTREKEILESFWKDIEEYIGETI